ncbi:MAG: type 1 glutamine amidotransferase domain-containing protein [Alphaproteobacteria bacterium]
MTDTLNGKNIAILVANGVEEAHLTAIQRAMLKHGAKAVVVSPENGLVNSWHNNGWGHYFPVDKSVDETLSADFDMLIIPGGVRSTDKLKGNAHTNRIITGFADGSKKIAALGHGVDLMINAERIAPMTVAVSEDLKEAVETAGGKVSEEVMISEDNLFTAIGDDEEQVDTVIEALLGFFAEVTVEEVAEAA